MSIDLPQGEDGAPVFDEAEQLHLFQRRLASFKMDRRQALQIFAAAGGAAALAACGSSNNNNNKSSNVAPTKAASSAANTAPSAGAGSVAAGAASPAGGGAAAAATGDGGPGPAPAGVKLAADQTFRWNIEDEPSSFDFNKDLYNASDQEVFAGLLRFNPDLKPIPDIAEKFDVNAEGTVFTFHLRKDSKWTNGQPVTAKDFDWSWRRQLNPATKAPYASFLYDIKGAEAYNTTKVPDDKGLGIKVVDDYTLEVTTEHPAAYFPALVAYAAALPAYKDAVEKFGYRLNNSRGSRQRPMTRRD